MCLREILQKIVEDDESVLLCDPNFEDILDHFSRMEHNHFLTEIIRCDMDQHCFVRSSLSVRKENVVLGFAEDLNKMNG